MKTERPENMDNERAESLHKKHITARFRELGKRSGVTGRFTYTDFLSRSDSVYLKEAGYSEKGDPAVKIWGGADDTERVMFRFGDPDIIGYEEPFPIAIIEVKPRSENFGRLDHRDVLGTVMGLGIERSTVGDILINDEGAYLFAVQEMADYIVQNITMVKHMSVDLSIVEKLPEGLKKEFRILDLVVPSLRADCFAAALLHGSRSMGSRCIKEKKMLVNGNTVIKNTQILSQGDIIVIRGRGKFIFDGSVGNTGRGNLHVRIREYK